MITDYLPVLGTLVSRTPKYVTIFTITYLLYEIVMITYYPPPRDRLLRSAAVRYLYATPKTLA